MDELDRDGLPVLPEPPHHGGMVEDITMEELEAQRIDKREELLQPDATAPALAGLSSQMGLVEQRLLALTERFDALIRVLKERRY